MNKSSPRNPLRRLAHEYSLALVFCYFYYCNQGCFNCAQKRAFKPSFIYDGLWVAVSRYLPSILLHPFIKDIYCVKMEGGKKQE